mgnify:FL=1
MKIVDDLIAWLYALKVQQYQAGLEELADDNYHFTDNDCWAFRFRNNSYDPYDTKVVYKPLLHASLVPRAIEIIVPYSHLVQVEQHYVRSVLIALVQAGVASMHHHLPSQFHDQLAGVILLSPEPLPQHVWENIKVVHARGLSLINERLLLNDLGV